MRVAQPVIIEGIEFDALNDATITMASTIPNYPVEDGFSVSDTIVNDPLELSMSLYVTNTPVTWLYRHGTSMSRVKSICDQLEALWDSKKLVKCVTNDAIYTDMGVTKIVINKSPDLGYSRKIDITMRKVPTTSRRTVTIPVDVLKSGATGASGGSATTSSGGVDSATEKINAIAENSKGKSILYGAASALGFI